MPSQGWAGSQANPDHRPECAPCLLRGRSRPSRTIVEGTAACLPCFEEWLKQPIYGPIVQWMRRSLTG